VPPLSSSRRSQASSTSSTRTPNSERVRTSPCSAAPERAADSTVCASLALAPSVCCCAVAVPQWGEVQHRIKYTEPIALLPNLNSVKGAAIDPALRRATRVPWGQGQSSSAFLPLHLTQLPSSPLGKHPAPTPEMPVVDNYSALGKVPYHQSAPESLNPWVRNPPHRASTRQIYERLYGPEKKVPQKSKGVL
jgi:hypothetical protein